MVGITDAWLRRSWRKGDRDQWLSDGGSRGSSRLVAKRSPAGVTFYFQYFDSSKRKRFMSIGPYDSKGVRGLSLVAARDKAAELSRLSRTGVRDLHDHFENKRLEQERVEEAAAADARREALDAKRCTLRQLCQHYVDHLETRGKKRSASDVRGLFKNHLFAVVPELGDRRAATIKAKEFAPLVRRLVEKGHVNSPAKLRSYLHAAYSLALVAPTDPNAPGAVADFGIEANPIAGIATVTGARRKRERALSELELHHFLVRLAARPITPQRDAVMALMYLGGQRPYQLLRARPENVDLRAARLELLDPKGRRSEPRRHLLPLIDDAVRVFQRRMALTRPGTPVFSTDGETQMRPETVTEYISAISLEMLEAGEVREAFQLRDIRRTCETMLASLGVSKDIRGQVQSHGLATLQDRVYDKYEYAIEKRDTLEKFARYLHRVTKGGASAKVISPVFGAKRRKES